MNQARALVDGSQLAREASVIVQDTVGCGVETVTPISRGMMTHKFIVHSAGTDYIVRFYPADRHFVVDYEPDTVRRCRACGLPVPEVLVDSRTGPAASLGYLMYPMIRGVSLAERLTTSAPVSQTGCYSRLVDCLRQMQEIRFQGAGEIISSRSAPAQSWSDFVRQAYSEGLEAVTKHQLLDLPTVQSLNNIAHFSEHISGGTTSDFIWGDPTAQNILVTDQGDLAGLIDFESVLAGDPLATLGNLYAAHADEDFFQTIITLWPQPLGGPPWRRILFYAILRTMRLAKFAHLPLPTGKPRAPLAEIFPNFRRALREFQSCS